MLNNKILLTTNGKGISPILAKASGLAELYERFCYYNYTTTLPFYVYKDIIKQQHNINTISVQELLNDEHIKYLLKTLLLDFNIDNIKKYIQMIYGNNINIYGNQFQNLNNVNDIKYKNIQLLSWCTGSNGVSTGNTLEEALVQGCSELYEREIMELFFHNKINEFYKINIQSLNPLIQNYIIKLKEKNIDIDIYDCSYILNTPVVMLSAFIKTNNQFYYKFGAHPIFDIALERCFTELYQGVDIPLNYYKNYQGITQYYNSLWADMTVKYMKNTKHRYGYINEHLIENTKNVLSYNTKIFINNNQQLTNQILLEHIKNLNNKNNKIYYYTNLSLTKDMTTIYIVQKELTQMANIDQIQILNKKYNYQTIIFVNKILQQLINTYNFLITQNSKIDLNILQQKIYTLFNEISLLNIDTLDEALNLIIDFIPCNYYGNFVLQEFNNISAQEYFYMILDILFQKEIKHNYNFSQHRMYELYKLIESYYIQKYSKEKIKKILNWLHYEDIELNFELKDMTPLWYINKIFIEPLYAKYHSQEYYDFINIFGPDETITKKENVKILEDSN